MLWRAGLNVGVWCGAVDVIAHTTKQLHPNLAAKLPIAEAMGTCLSQRGTVQHVPAVVLISPCVLYRGRRLLARPRHP